LPKAVATAPESLPPSPEKTAAAGAVYTLKGIAGDGGKRLALTHDGEKTVTVGVGEKVGEYTVVEIGEDYLRMTKEGEIKELRLGDGSENR